jgi:hypothetical protein
MFHWVTGIPFGSELHGGAYDDLTLWEQIDGGAQNTPSRKWLFSVPVGLCVFYPFSHSILSDTHATENSNSFLLSTHYTNYNPWLFAINISALIFALVPKLPMVRSMSFSGHSSYDGTLTSLNFRQAHRQRLRILPHDPSTPATPISTTSGTNTPPDHVHAQPDLHLTDAQFR